MTIAEKKQGGYKHLIDWIIGIGDVAVINGFLILMYVLFNEQLYHENNLSDKNLVEAILLINLCYFISSWVVRNNISSNIVNIDRIIQNTTSFIVLYSVILTASFSIFHIVQISILHFIIVFFILGTFIMLWRVGLRLLLKSYRRKGYNFRAVIIIGGGINGINIYNELVGSDFGYKIIGFFDDNIQNKDALPNYLGDTSKVKEYIGDYKIDEIYCTLPGNQEAKIMELITLSEKNMIRLYLVPEFHKYVKRRFTFHILDTMPVLSLRYEPLEHVSNRLIKRGFDVVFSGLVLIAIFPIIYLIFGVAIKYSSPGPILFKQQRTGLKGQDFYCYKFRSMCLNEKADKESAKKNDPRVTKVGAFMRKTSIDELPQFINVLKGDMSIVGPRPHMLEHTEYYSMLIDKFMVRHLVKPGITGWAQVTGFRGETKKLLDMENRVKKDVWYLENWSFFLDVKIIMQTVLNAIRGESNAY